MFCYIFLFCFVYLVNGQVVNNVRIINHASYFVSLVQEVMYEVEETGLCNLKVADASRDYDEHVYSWHISGTVRHTNGIVIGIESMDLRQDSVQQLWRHDATPNTTFVTIQGTLRLHEVQVGYDVVASMTDGEHFLTGVYPFLLIELRLQLEINAHTNAMTATGSVLSTSGGSNRRIHYLPDTKLGEFLSRNYAPSSVFDSAGHWAKDILAPKLLAIATNKIQFPGLCYNCS